MRQDSGEYTLEDTSTEQAGTQSPPTTPHPGAKLDTVICGLRAFDQDSVELIGRVISTSSCSKAPQYILIRADRQHTKITFYLLRLLMFYLRPLRHIRSQSGQVPRLARSGRCRFSLKRRNASVLAPLTTQELLRQIVVVQTVCVTQAPAEDVSNENVCVVAITVAMD